MDCRDLVVDGLKRVDETLRLVLDGLSSEQLAFRPADNANSIAWLAWHLSRVQDHHLADAAGTSQVWLDEGWPARFGRAADKNDIGFGNTAAQVATVRPDSPQLLIDYSAAVHRRSLAYLRTLTCEDLDRVVDTRWDPPVTLGVRLVSVVNDCTQHAGQMAYVRGLLENRRWFRA